MRGVVVVEQIEVTNALDQTLVVTWTFQALPTRVFQSWTEVDRFREWWGPHGASMIAGTLDLRPGGLFHFGMRVADGREIWAKWTFLEVECPNRLVFIATASDALGESIRHPLVPDWPRETLSTVTCRGNGDRTELRLEAIPIGASEKECVIFSALRQSMAHGWSGMLEKLETYLAR